MADDFTPIAAPSALKDDFQPLAATHQDDFEPATSAPTAAPGYLATAAQATKEQAMRAYGSMEAAGKVGLPFWSATGPSRVGESATGLVEAAAVPFTPGMSLGKQFGEAHPDITLGAAHLLLGRTQQEAAIRGYGPQSNRELTPEERVKAAGEIGETVGGLIGPYGVAKRLGRLIPRGGAAALAPAVELPAQAAATRALPQIPGPVVAESRPITRTLEAAAESQSGRGLDLGTVGQQRAVQRNMPRDIAEAVPEVPPTTASVPVPTTPAEVIDTAAPGILKRGKDAVGSVVRGIRRATATDTPSDFAKGIPDAEALIEKVQDRAVTRRLLEEDIVRQVADIYKPLGKDQGAVRNVNRLLDTEGGAELAKQVLSPAEQKVYAGARKWFNDLADSMGLEPDKRITDYFPRLREQLGVQEKKVIQVGKDEVPTYITDTTPNRIVKEHFEKPRTSAAPADDLGMEPVIAYARGASRKIAYGGGVNPATGERLTPLLEDIGGHLPGIPDEKAKYFADYVNDVIGIPRGKPGEISQSLIDVNQALRQKTGADVMGWEFGRTISGNVMSPANNLTQTVLTLGHVHPMDWASSWKDIVPTMRNKAKLEQMRKLGIISDINKADEDLLAQMGAKKGIASLIEKGAGFFQTTENINRAHAYIAALKTAERRGLEGAKAEQFAKNVVRKTQFVFGPEDASELARTVRNPLGRSVLQYKSFPAKFGIAVKQMAQDDLADLGKFTSNLAKGDIGAALRSAPTRTAKVAGATSALFGAGAVIPHADELFNLDPNSMASTGLVGAMGLSFGQSIGLGVMPLDSMRSLMFWLPGPLISHFLDAASAGASLATGSQYNFDLASLQKGEFGKVSPEIDPEITAARIVRSIPLAGIQLDRIRKGIIHYRSEAPEAQRKPATGAQALGLSPVGSGNEYMRTIQPPGPMNFWAKLLGPQAVAAFNIASGSHGPREDAISRLTDKLMTDQKMDAAAAKAAAIRLISGDEEGARGIIERRGLPPTPAAVGGAIERAAIPPEIRHGIRAPLPLRGPYLEKLPRLPGGITGRE